MKVMGWVGTILAVGSSVVSALLERSWGLGVPLQVLTLGLGVAVSSLAGRVAGLGASVLAVLAFNYWFTEPLYTFFVDDPQNYFLFALFVLLGLLVGTLSARFRKLAREHVLQGFSHDLRTPLTVISGTAAQLRASLAGRLGADEPAFSVIEREARDLDRQIDNLIALARVGSGLRPVLVPAEELLFSCRDRCASWLPGLEVEVPEQVPLVKVDPALVEQALLNLVVNASRYAGPAAPTLSAALTGKSVELRVGDRGPGVADAEKAAIFGRFVRGGNPKSRGHGLGLSLVAEVARLHGGRAGVRDREGGGAEFFLRLPLRGLS